VTDPSGAVVANIHGCDSGVRRANAFGHTAKPATTKLEILRQASTRSRRMPRGFHFLCKTTWRCRRPRPRNHIALKSTKAGKSHARERRRRSREPRGIMPAPIVLSGKDRKPCDDPDELLADLQALADLQRSRWRAAVHRSDSPAGSFRRSRRFGEIRINQNRFPAEYESWATDASKFSPNPGRYGQFSVCGNDSG